MKFLALAFIMLVFCVYTILNTLGHKMSEGMPWGLKFSTYDKVHKPCTSSSHTYQVIGVAGIVWRRLHRLLRFTRFSPCNCCTKLNFWLCWMSRAVEQFLYSLPSKVLRFFSSETIRDRGIHPQEGAFRKVRMGGGYLKKL